MSHVDYRPEITVTHEDLAILSGLVQAAMAEGRYAAGSRLADELHRARVVSAAQAPEDCLVLNRPGQYLEERSGARRDIVLVAGRGSPATGMVSVLSRVGTALLGLSEGQGVSWLDPLGKPRAVRLLKVGRRAA